MAGRKEKLAAMLASEKGAPKRKGSLTKREKLRVVLMEKLGKKYNGNEATISLHVDAFLDSHKDSNILASHIDNLERTVAKALSSRPPSSQPRNNSRSYEQKHQENDDLPEDSYQVIQEASAAEFRRDERKRLQEKARQQRIMKAQLDSQVEARKREIERARQEKEEYAKIIVQQVSSWSLEEKKKADKIKSLNAKTRRDRDEQMKIKSKREEELAKRKLAEEEAMIKKYRQELADQEQKRKDAIKVQNMYMHKTKEHNDLLRKERAKQAELDRLEDQRLQEENNRAEEAKEKMRVDAFNRMKAKSANNQEAFVKNTEAARKAEADTLARINAHQKKHADEEDRKARERFLKIKHDKVKMNQSLAEQTRQRELEKQKYAAFEKQFSDGYKAEAQKAIADEHKAARQRKQNMVRHRMELEEQIRRNTSRKELERDQMSSDETALNLATIRGIKSDAYLATEVKKRIAQSKAVSTSKNKGKRRCNLDGDEIDY